MATTYTGVRRVTVGPDETIIELHDAHDGHRPVRLTPMAVQELFEALAQALVQIRGRSPPWNGRSTPSPRGTR